MVRLRDTQDEALLRDTFRVFFREQSPPSLVRRAEPLGHDTELWSRLAEVGALDMGVPTSAGGGGASFPDLVIVAEEFGRAVAPVAASTYGPRIGCSRSVGRLRSSVAPLTSTTTEGWIDHHVRHSPVTRIAGGTTEINRNNIAERHLGLPRAR